MNLRIRNLSAISPPGKRLVIDGKSKIIDGKGVSAPQKRSEVFYCDGCVIYCVTFFMYIDYVYMYLMVARATAKDRWYLSAKGKNLFLSMLKIKRATTSKAF